MGKKSQEILTHVDKKYHTKIVILLVLIIAILSVLLIAVLFQIGSRTNYESTYIENYANGLKENELTVMQTPYLKEEELIVLDSNNEEKKLLPLNKSLFEYVEVVGSCGPFMEEECLNIRSGPSTSSPVVAKIRNGAVLKIDGIVENGDEVWFKIVFDEWLRYPERVSGQWYIYADYVEILFDEGDKTIWEDEYVANTKKIVIDCTLQTLSAYENDELFLQEKISTGIDLTPTPKGTFSIFKKTPSRYMQGPIYGISTKYYDLPGVPWNLYFTSGGAVIHGAYWHKSFGSKYSNGCVNLPPEAARKLYYWADLGTSVIVK